MSQARLHVRRAEAVGERYELIGRISSGLAHELNGPIGIALGFTELAKELLHAAGDGFLQPASLAKLKEYLNLTESANTRARTLARRISAFAKLQPGTVTEFDLPEALDDAASLANPALKVAQLEVTRRAGLSGPAPVRGDHALSVINFVKLFLTSPEALPDGGTVVWEVTRRTGESGSQTRFVIVAEPWGTAQSRVWRIPDSIREAFASQGGLIGPAVSRRAAKQGDGPTGAPAWELPGWLPAATAGEEPARGQDAVRNSVTKPHPAPAKVGQRAAGK